MRNFTPAALAIAHDIYKEDHFLNITEKPCASVKIKPKQKLCPINYVTGKFKRAYKLRY